MLEVSNNCSPSPLFASGFLPPKTLFLFPPATDSSAWSHSTGNAIKCFTSIPAHVHMPRNAFARKRLSVLGDWYRGKLDVIQISPRDQVDRQRGWRNWPGTSKIHPWAIRGLFFFLVVILSWRTMKTTLSSVCSSLLLVSISIKSLISMKQCGLRVERIFSPLPPSS